MRVVDAVAGTIRDPHFHHAFADALGIPRISQFHAADAGNNPCDGIGILQAVQPARKFFRLAHFDHEAVLYPIGYNRSSLPAKCWE